MKTKPTVLMLLLLSSMSALITPKASGLVPATISVSPPTNKYEKGQVFTVDIKFTNVWDEVLEDWLYHVHEWGVTLKYDIGLLYTNETLIKEGPFLKGGGTTYFPTPFFGAGYVQLGCLLIATDANVGGSGTLANITFVVMDTGKTNLTLTDTSLKEPYNVDIPHETVGGIFFTTYPKASFYYLPSRSPPPLDYYPDPSLLRDPVVGETVAFNASAYTVGGFYGGSYDPDGFITSCAWDFGDGSTVTVYTPVVVHVYIENKSYIVTLTVTDNDGKTDTFSQYVVVTSAPAPRGTVVFVYPQWSSASPSSTFRIDVMVYNVTVLYAWQFRLSWNTDVLEFVSVAEGPFLNSSGAYPSFFVSKINYTAGWVYAASTLIGVGREASATGSGVLATVTFKAKGLGQSALDLWHTMLINFDAVKISHSVEDGYFDNQALIASFDYLPLKPVVGENVTFDASSSYDPDGYIVSYTWYFGDETTTTETSPITTHVYWNTGVYTVRLTVTDNSGQTKSVQKTLKVYAPPAASFTWTSEKPRANETVTFEAFAYDPDGWVVSYEWDFGDGAYAFGFKVYHVYAQIGTYTVVLTVRDNDGFTTTVKAQMTVLPKITISIAPDKGIVGTTVTVSGTNATPNGAVNIYWGSYYEWWRLNYTLIGTLTADSIGEFSFSFEVPLSTLGIHFVRATDLTTEAYDERTFYVRPYISIDPTSGPAGTKVTVKGTGFPYAPGPVSYLMFDDQFFAFAMSDEYGNVEAYINVPLAAPGPHAVKALLMAYDPYYLGPSRYYTLEATFIIIDTTALEVTADVGAFYFRGETAEFYIQTVFKGTPINVTSVKATLHKPDGTVETLTAQNVATGLYKALYSISADAAVGTYVLVVEAIYLTDTIDSKGASLKSFILSPTLTGWNAVLIGINENVGTIKTDAGLINLKLDAIKDIQLIRMENRMATINSTVGLIQADISIIKPKLIKIEGTTVTINSTMGLIQVDIAAIEATLQGWIGGTATSIITPIGTFNILVLTTSTLQSLTFSDNTITLIVSGPTGTTGTVNVVIPKQLLTGIESTIEKVAATVNDKQVVYTYTEYPETYVLSISYTHSTQTIKIFLAGIPQPPLPLAIVLTIVITIMVMTVAIALYMKRIRKIPIKP